MKDTLKHKGLRQQLVALITEKGIKDEKVLKAIGNVPRHLFMDSGFLDHAYQDKAFPIAAEQTISQPYTVAFQSETLLINSGEDCRTSSDCDIRRGLCCKLQRRARSQPKKVRK